MSDHAYKDFADDREARLAGERIEWLEQELAEMKAVWKKCPKCKRTLLRRHYYSRNSQCKDCRRIAAAKMWHIKKEHERVVKNVTTKKWGDQPI